MFNVNESNNKIKNKVEFYFKDAKRHMSHEWAAARLLQLWITKKNIIKPWFRNKTS